MEPRTDIAEFRPLPDGTREMRLHFHRGQRKAIHSHKRFVLILAGTQSGKTSFGPYWLYNEMQSRGPGDYLVATPTFPLLELKLLPEFKRLFEEHLQLGSYIGSPTRRFTLSSRGEEVVFGAVQTDPTHIYFGHAQDPDSLESMTAKAAWLDEAGQKKFKRGSWEAIRRRLSIHQGRVLFTTTPYGLGWLKSEVHDRAKDGHPDYEVIQFESTMNPAFPLAEFEERRDTLPAWKFNMMYRGLFERPAGMIYDVFDRTVHLTPDKPEGPRYDGLDFGGVNTAAVTAINAPNSLRYVVTRLYQAGNRTAKEHANALLSHGKPVRAWGGSGSEGQWRSEFAAAGYPILEPPVTGAASVEVGIDRVYALLKNHPLLAGRPDPGDPSAVIKHDPSRPYVEFYGDGDGVMDLVDDIEMLRPRARRQRRADGEDRG